MLIAYSMPEITSVTLSGGSATWLTADDGAACVDGKPARRARFQWRDEASPLPAHRVSITLAFALTQVRVCALLGLVGVPEGTVVHVLGRDFDDAGTTYDFGGGGANVATVRRFADGTYGCWWVLPTTATTVREVEFRIYNDDTGATWADANSVVDVGEIVVMPAVDVKIDRGWTMAQVDPSVVGTTVGSQVSVIQRTPYRELEVTFSLAQESAVRLGGLANGMDWERLGAALAGGRRCCAIPRWETLVGSGAVDGDKLHANAIYGVAIATGPTAHLRGPWWHRPLGFREIPAGA